MSLHPGGSIEHAGRSRRSDLPITVGRIMHFGIRGPSAKMLEDGTGGTSPVSNILAVSSPMVHFAPIGSTGRHRRAASGYGYRAEAMSC